MNSDLFKFVFQYVATAFWTSFEEDNEYVLIDLAKETLDKVVIDCEKFMADNKKYMDLKEQEISSFAHDFWLTRNGHGAGFWDGDYNEEYAKELTAYAEECGEVNFYVGDGGKIYC